MTPYASNTASPVESEASLGKLWRSVEQMADALIIMDRSGVMEYLNPAFEALTGYSWQEAIGQTLRMLKSEQQAGDPLRWDVEHGSLRERVPGNHDEPEKEWGNHAAAPDW
jgi:PAS domain-containing protein